LQDEFKALEDKPEDHNGLGAASCCTFFLDKAKKNAEAVG